MLDDRLAGSERAGDAGGAALGQREEGVDHPLPGDQRRVGVDLAPVRTADANRPLMREAQLVGGAQLVGQRADHFPDRERAGAQAAERAGQAGRHHDPVLDDLRLLYPAEPLSGAHLLAAGGGRGELPDTLLVDRGRLDAAGDELAVVAGDHVQRPLDAVVDLLDESGAELDRELRAGGGHLLARADAAGLLVDLDRHAVALDADDLAEQAGVADLDHLVHDRVLQALRLHQGARNPRDDPSHFLFLPLVRVPCVSSRRADRCRSPVRRRGGCARSRCRESPTGRGR